MKEKKEKIVWVQVCPKCLSPRLRKVGSLSSDMTSSIDYLAWKYECLDCGWTGRLVIEQEIDISKLKTRGKDS
jgi:hypothetical protein